MTEDVAGGGPFRGLLPLGGAERGSSALVPLNQAMGSGREFDVIRNLIDRWGSLAVGIGDDAAVLSPESGLYRVVSTDAFVENVHFKREWLTPREIGARAAAGALSDLAAMGASAEAILISITLPENWLDVVGEIADGIASQVRRSGSRIIGGNMSRSSVFSITSTVIGKAARPVTRSGARPGDIVVVTGELGGAGAALAAWKKGEQPTEWARARFAAPEPRLVEGVLLEAAGATSMIDISDGLLADSQHIAAASGVRLAIDTSLLPCGRGVVPEAASLSGEEYELLATIPAHRLEALLTEWPSKSAIGLTAIGRVESANSGYETSGSRASMVPASGHGHDHFG